MKWESAPVGASATSCIWSQSASIYERSFTTVAPKRNKATIQIDVEVADLDPGLNYFIIDPFLTTDRSPRRRGGRDGRDGGGRRRRKQVDLDWSMDY